jgi:redox-sensitive bicupin YhaK (pirin superfamily)
VSARTAVAAPPTTWRNRIAGAGEEAPDQLLANPANWRIHPKTQQDALAGALDAVGWVQQVLVNRRTGFVVDGHARVALALSRGEPSVPVLYVDLATHEATPRDGVPAHRAVEWLRVLGETWVSADIPEARADLLHAIYERITVVGRSVVSVRLTQAAYKHGLALALPDAVMARPEGFEPPTLWSEATCSSPLSYGRAAADGGRPMIPPPCVASRSPVAAAPKSADRRHPRIVVSSSGGERAAEVRIMSTPRPGLAALAQGGLQVIPATAFHRLTEREFGMPGLVAIESVGPFVELGKVGPFITIHDSTLAPGLGIGHHPHRGNERLFYILRGEIRHDDSLNDIQGVMGEGDLARLTEGRRGMRHREWNGRDDITTHAFILVYTPDTEPPIERASFDALRAADAPRATEAPGVETIELIGGSSPFRANLRSLRCFLDSTLADGAGVTVDLPPDSGMIVYPLEGTIHLDGGDDGVVALPGTSEVHPEGPDAMAVVWSGTTGRSVGLAAGAQPGRVIRLEFARTAHDLVRQSPRVRNP